MLVMYALVMIALVGVRAVVLVEVDLEQWQMQL